MQQLQIAYILVLEFLSAADPDDRLRRATTLFVKQSSISEVSKRIAQSVDESLSKQQKEFFLRQQQAAIERELKNLRRTSSPLGPPGNMPKDESSGNSSESELDNEEAEAEDMADIKSKIEAMAKDSEERKMAVREWRRLKRIPQGSVEHGVIRNYVGFPRWTIQFDTNICDLAARMAHRDPMDRVIHHYTFHCR